VSAERKVCTYCGAEGHRASQCPLRPRERDIEAHLVKRVEELGGEVRKVKWGGRRGAPDRLVMLPFHAERVGRSSACRTVWVELKAPGKKATFPDDERERAQHREHERMRKMGQCVVVIDSIEGVEELLG
jgi:hypothetical protein